jgi:hypothetical protein
MVYIFCGLFKESRRGDCDVQRVAIYLIVVKFLLFPEYKDYGDIFSFKEYMEIAENPQTIYAIDLAENIIIFYKSIYYFSEKKLRVLRECLEKNQQKDWIRSSKLSTDVPIFFCPEG